MTAVPKNTRDSVVSMLRPHCGEKETAASYDRYIGGRLRFARQISGLSQAALGKQTGLSFQQVQKHENGSVRISAGRLLTFANALSLPVSFFFDGIEQDDISGGFLEQRFVDLSDFSEDRRACIHIIARAEESDITELVSFLEHFIVSAPRPRRVL